MLTETGSRIIPREISATRSPVIVPIVASACGSFHAWLKTRVFGYFAARSPGASPRRRSIACSDIGG